MFRFALRGLLALLGLIALSQVPDFAQDASSILIVNAQVADGTGRALRKANVRVKSDRIAAIRSSLKPTPNEQVIDAKGLVLAPGFIDIHNHSTERLESDPLAETQISQGITSLVVGADGDSPWPITPWVDSRRKNPVSLNVAVMAGHATIREQVLGTDFKRISTPAEVEKMSQLVTQAMQEGAIGVSSGLEYEVGSYSATDELVSMSAAAAKFPGA